MKKILQFLAMLPALILTLVLCNGCEEAAGEIDEIATYTVTFETNGGSYIANSKVESGSTVDRPTDPTKDGYSFDGWYSDVDLTEMFDFNEAIVSDITIYAKWAALSYTVTFDSNGGTAINSQTVEFNSTATEPSAPTKDGSTFSGWYSNAELSSEYDFSTLITANITIYAKWDTNQYTITFETNGGSDITSQTVDYNTTATKPTDPTRTGYTFGGWFADSALTDVWSFSIAVTADITLYAKWFISPVITFETNGGSTIEPQTIDYNTTITQPTTSRTGYTFNGWYSDSGLTNVWNFNSLVTADMTLYAKWTINEYTITFESNGGGDIASQTVDYNSTVTEPTTPTRTGYTFAGWYSDSAFTSSYSFNTAVTEDITLYAKWTINTYTVTFESNGGIAVSSQTVDYNTTATEPAEPTRTSYTFVGWYSDSALTQEWSFDNQIIADTTIYAKWISTSGNIPDMGTGNAW